MQLRSVSRTALAASLGVLLAACGDDTDGDVVTPGVGVQPVALKNQSVTPALLRSLVPGVEIFSLVSSDDQLAGSPSFRFGGSADGAGLIRNGDGTFTLLTNHEDNFAVSRVRFDKDLKPTVGRLRRELHGRPLPPLLGDPRHGRGARVQRVPHGRREQRGVRDPRRRPVGPANTPKYLSAFGRFNTRTPCRFRRPRSPNRTVVLIGDDDSSAEGGQVAMYLSNTVGDLDNGSLYVLARTDNNTAERDMVVGQSYPGAVPPDREPEDAHGPPDQPGGRHAQRDRFARVEDLDYRKGSAANNREVYFVATGQNNTA
jgi:hypothetical protein